ncbi:UxaA family hydrolase [uncultured Veillonella sp.]|uniref:UxaA family hydrolase n=1 Tax=uncultured Veillonella sp. TaxID=159268 RepID=UPI0026278A80|nr:UxaA family hydrolase [uncultured Veillonella sp.]
MKSNAVRIDAADTVAVVIEPIEKGSEVRFMDHDKLVTLTAQADVPIYHKIAIKEMKEKEPVVKYGQHIGLAGNAIHVGEHVHTHNVESHREEL